MNKRELEPLEKFKKTLGKTSSTPDVATALESLKYERQSLHVQNLSQNINLRRRFAWLLFVVLVLWLLLIVYIVVGTGAGCLIFFSHQTEFHLSDAVIIALITTTTANIIGFFYVVTNYLFPKGETAEERPN